MARRPEDVQLNAQVELFRQQWHQQRDKARDIKEQVYDLWKQYYAQQDREDAARPAYREAKAKLQLARKFNEWDEGRLAMLKKLTTP